MFFFLNCTDLSLFSPKIKLGKITEKALPDKAYFFFSISCTNTLKTRQNKWKSDPKKKSLTLFVFAIISLKQCPKKNPFLVLKKNFYFK